MALNVGELYATIGMDTTSATGSVTRFGESMKKIGGSIAGVGKKMTVGLTVPILAAATASIKLASDYEESLNKVDVAFKDNASEVKAWSKTSLTAFGISSGAALEMTSLFGDMASGMDINTSEAAKMSTKLAGLSGDLASFKNIGLDQAQNALKGIFTGEGESLKSLGIIMTDATLSAYALASGQKKTWKEMTQAEKVTLRYNFVLDKTENAQGDFARTSDGTANSSRIFTESLKELGIQLGTHLLPIITPIIQKFTELVQKFTELSPETQKNILVIAGIVAAIGPLLVVIGTLVSSVGSIITGFAAASGAITAAGGVIALLTSPIILIIAAIVGFIAIIVHLYKTNEEFRDKVNAIWDNIKKIFSETLDEIKIFITQFIALTKAFWAKYGDDIMSLVDKAFTLVSGIITTALTLIKNIITIATGLITGDWDKVWTGIKDTVQTVWDGIWSVISGSLDLIKDTISIAITFIKDIVKNMFKGTSIKPPKITMPKIPSVSFGGVRGNIPQSANGNIFKKPTLTAIGERGLEAAVPLTGSAANAFASAFMQRLQGLGGSSLDMGSGITININGDVRDPAAFAKMISREIRYETDRKNRSRGR